jgi:hypothetical protein
MYIRRLLYSNPGRYAISIILGLGLATLFRKVCKNRECLVFHAPSINKIKDQVFHFDNKCYTFEETAESCNVSKKILRFA